MTKEVAYNSFRAGEALVDAHVKAGKLSPEQAYKIIKNARENYRHLTFEREHASRNTGK